MRIKETLIVDISGRKVRIVNDGIKKLEDQSGGVEAVKTVIAGDIADGRVTGWTPYANFEASIKWDVVEEYYCQTCKKNFYWPINHDLHYGYDIDEGEDYPLCLDCYKKSQDEFRKEMMGGSLFDVLGDALNPNNDE